MSEIIPNDTYMVDYTNIDETYKYCVDKIMEIKNSKYFYIGATQYPNKRLKQHIDEKKMKTMFLLVKTFTEKQAERLEKKLIYRFNKDGKSNKSINQSGGSEGIKDGVNYIYILFY